MPCSDLLCSVKRKSETGREKEEELGGLPAGLIMRERNTGSGSLSSQKRHRRGSKVECSPGLFYNYRKYRDLIVNQVSYYSRVQMKKCLK
jgi:hypothetical protein